VRPITHFFYEPADVRVPHANSCKAPPCFSFLSFRSGPFMDLTARFAASLLGVIENWKSICFS
jgi:hypothetical protein